MNVTWHFGKHHYTEMLPYYKLQPTRCIFSWIYFYRCSTCFRQFLCPSSGARNCTYSFRYCQPILVLAATINKMEDGRVSSYPW